MWVFNIFDVQNMSTILCNCKQKTRTKVLKRLGLKQIIYHRKG